ncbi:hypothetical protein [Ruegeria sp. MALMAid1280]|uniref:hypothetical protein n=1 Tax=Ruegeria sp. MALMAid1280 TaxID=3411634 RepID=UPI003B9F5589
MSIEFFVPACAASGALYPQGLDQGCPGLNAALHLAVKSLPLDLVTEPPPEVNFSEKANEALLLAGQISQRITKSKGILFVRESEDAPIRVG